METNSLQNDVLAVETHAGRAWSLLMLPMLIVPAVSVIFYPTSAARFALVIVAVVGIGALGLVLSGFQYRFLRHGVEISTLGIRLRTIPRQQIVSYSIESWGLPRGYGIRGIGRTRAYVWGNKVVHVKTTNGDVYLGHNDPEKIVRDLNQVTGFATSGEGIAMGSTTAEFSQKESTNRGWHKALIGMMWVALASTGLSYMDAWDQLPGRMAVHFDANWQPNGYTSREGALEMGLGIMAVLLVVFTVAGLIASAQKPSAFWPMLIVFYVVLGFVWYGNYSIIKFNLNAQPGHSELVDQRRSSQLSVLGS
jgi:hypothetical protein